MKVICSGLPKTGTKTLSAALRILGYKVYDLEEQFFYIGDELMKVMNEGWTTEDIRRIFDGVDAITDIPACLLWEELLKAFPDAKVVHTERATEEEWIKSLQKQADSFAVESFVRWIILLSPTGRKLHASLKTSSRLFISIQPSQPWRPAVINHPLAKLRYRQHNTYVREVKKDDNILFFKLTEGWEPLCKFLGKPKPKEEFPHKNKGGALTRELIDKSYIFDQIKKEIGIRIAFFVAVLAFLVIWFQLF